MNLCNLLYFLKRKPNTYCSENKLTCTLWAHCDSKKAPLIIHRLVRTSAGSFILYYKGM